jgi:hypothetical protein
MEGQERQRRLRPSHLLCSNRYLELVEHKGLEIAERFRANEL